MSQRIFVVILIAIFLFRLLFGITSEFWFEDELQIYLSGLKFYTTSLWPYWGPDIVYNQTQIPGPLQGLLVGLPFYLFPIPEIPYILLNVLSFVALLFLASYISKIYTQIPSILIYFWCLLSPWVLRFGTHILNPSYVLFGAVLFL